MVGVHCRRDPGGLYELRLELPGGETLHQAIVASAGWQTQLFIFMRGYPGVATEGAPLPAEWRADLARTSVLLARDKGFSHDEPLLRVAELARVALASKRRGAQTEPGRPLLPEELRALLRQKCENPMLGIYAAHLLLLEATVDVTLFRGLVRELRGLVGASHPDVEALALRAEGEPPPSPFETPPMLRRSWSLIVDATADQPELVPEELTGRATSDFWAEGPWHIWRRAGADGAGAPGLTDLTDAEVALAEDLGVLKQVRSARSATLGGARTMDTPATRGSASDQVDVAGDCAVFE